MFGRTIRVLVVDDSQLIRALITDLLEEAKDIEVVGTAADGMEAVRLARSLKPDVVTLDVQMPKMDGLQTLEKMLEEQPIAVIMVSATTQLGGQITLDALDRGALDYIAKPEGLKEAETTLRTELCRKIRSVASTDVQRVLTMRRERAEQRRKRLEKSAVSREKKPIATATPASDLPVSDKCIALGISTGGPPALTSIFELLPAGLPPIVIVQHMPANFTKAFAMRLNSISKVNVKEAETGDVIQPGHAYLAPGGLHLEVRKNGRSGGKLHVREGDPVSGHRPSVDVMMSSVASVYGNRVLGIVMTGMGRDGSDGCKAIRNAGGYVLGQDEASSDVYGMNKVAFQEGNVDRQFSLDEAATLFANQVRRLWGAACAT
ncbi:chemotaxis response regulator protein-glutamate methylesterase [Blastopirellula marina]|uniref:Protein-glutamate methylesterase/protein-glutamine glutaminase n=1 Tax=Blastopirellula marina TaxID=124 RepID=A0A2S8F7Z0_9BACT|nr:chemotaxis response regulator protein-glutamate methylesterase [Blastopirellula marina]PQO28268.1 chemotaxis response regulator protein-glutamate methylesterase [Blastopirellula marina]PTL41808.1 chemotaxis response regulator protein-glutamate methylesterase [Blastopirellula marina]